METLIKLFPLSFTANDISKLILNCLIYVVAATVIGFVIGILSHIPIIGFIFTLLSALLEIYLVFGLLILFLVYFKVIK